MDTREWSNLQEALVWIYWPVIQLMLGLFVGTSVLTSIYILFVRLARWLTRAD